MSLSSVAKNATNARRMFPRAKRGMFCVIERVHSSTAVHGETRRTSTYEAGIVSAVTRDGQVKLVGLAGDRCITSCDVSGILGFQSVQIDYRGIVSNPRSLVDRLDACTFASLDEAVAEIKRLEGIS